MQQNAEMSVEDALVVMLAHFERRQVYGVNIRTNVGDDPSWPGVVRAATLVLKPRLDEIRARFM